jgi:hypothetical protein
MNIQNTINQTHGQTLGGIFTRYISPLNQIKSGISPNNVKCIEGLLLIIRKSNSNPVCLKPHDAQKFVGRNWGITDNYFIPKVSQDETIKIVNDDLHKHLPNLDKVIIFGIDPIPKYQDYPRHPLQLIYATPNGTESIINSTDYSLVEKCNTKVTMCLINNKLQLEAIQDKTSFLVDLDWSTKTGLNLPAFYLVDAQSGKILYSTLAENIPQDAKTEFKP